LPERLAQVRGERPHKRLLIFHQDEARFGQQGTLTRVWAPKGSRPTAVKQTELRRLTTVLLQPGIEKHADSAFDDSSPRVSLVYAQSSIE
jgi:hypothetical protein